MDKLQEEAALVINGFVIRGFGYPKILNYVQNLLSTDFSLGYPQIRYFLRTKKTNKGKNHININLFFSNVQSEPILFNKQNQNFKHFNIYIFLRQLRREVYNNI